MRALAKLFKDTYTELVAFGTWLKTVKESWPEQSHALKHEHRQRRFKLVKKCKYLCNRLP